MPDFNAGGFAHTPPPVEPPIRDARQLWFPFADPQRDFRSPKEIAAEIVEQIFADAPEDWEPRARPVIRITTTRPHIPPAGINERRRIAPPPIPVQVTRRIIRPVEEMARNDAGQVELSTEVRRAARAAAITANVKGNPAARRAAMVVLVLFALGALGGVLGNASSSTEPPAFLKEFLHIADKADALNQGLGGTRKARAKARTEGAGAMP